MPSVGVQVVLFDDSAERQLRLAGAIAAAARRMADGGVDRVAVRYGDCSPSPCLTTDDQRAIEGALAPWADVSFTFFDANLGSGGGSNALAAEGDDTHIWVLNPDTYPAPSAGAVLVAGFDADDVAATEARQVPAEHQKVHDPVSGETGWVSGFSTMFRRSAFESVGGFDDHFFPLYCDDVDLSWRLRLGGWRLRHLPRAAVFHECRIDLDGGIRWTPTKARSTHLAKLWLYRRYGRPDLEADFIDHVDTVSDPVAVDAVAEFRRRIDAGDVPAAIAGADSVAEFVDGQLAAPRFRYDR
jgi:hypothetical protein